MRVLNESEIRGLIGPREALDAVADAFAQLARGEATLPGVIQLDLPASRGEVHVKGAHLHGSPFYSIKVAAGFYDNKHLGLAVGSGLVLVFDARTGAAGALAARHLARAEVDLVGLVGCGSQARYQLEALLGVRRPRRVRVCLRFGELQHAVAEGVLTPGRVWAELGELAAGLKPGRTGEDEITVADLTGVGVQDAAVAARVTVAALDRGLGRTLDA